MSIDTYGLSTEQYQEFFEDNVRFAAELYLATCNILTGKGVGNVDFKTVLDIYSENVYATNDDCRRYQKINNPDVAKTYDGHILDLGPTREELMNEIKFVNAKVELLNAKIEMLTEYVTKLVTITTKGLDGIANTLVD